MSSRSRRLRRWQLRRRQHVTSRWRVMRLGIIVCAQRKLGPRPRLHMRSVRVRCSRLCRRLWRQNVLELKPRRPSTSVLQPSRLLSKLRPLRTRHEPRPRRRARSVSLLSALLSKQLLPRSDKSSGFSSNYRWQLRDRKSSLRHFVSVPSAPRAISRRPKPPPKPLSAQRVRRRRRFVAS